MWWFSDRTYPYWQIYCCARNVINSNFLDNPSNNKKVETVFSFQEFLAVRSVDPQYLNASIIMEVFLKIRRNTLFQYIDHLLNAVMILKNSYSILNSSYPILLNKTLFALTTGAFNARSVTWWKKKTILLLSIFKLNHSIPLKVKLGHLETKADFRNKTK